MTTTNDMAPAPRGRFGFPVLVVAILAIAALAFASAPWFAFRALRGAAEAQDPQALAELIDYGAVRTALRAQLKPQAALQPPPPDPWRDPIGAMRRALQAPLQSQVDVDAYLTPDALARLSNGQPPTGPAAIVASHPFPRIVYWDHRRCRIAVRDPADRTGRVLFTWQRRGLLDWKLVQIRLPSSPGAG